VPPTVLAIEPKDIKIAAIRDMTMPSIAPAGRSFRYSQLGVCEQVNFLRATARLV